MCLSNRPDDYQVPEGYVLTQEERERDERAKLNEKLALEVCFFLLTIFIIRKFSKFQKKYILMTRIFKCFKSGMCLKSLKIRMRQMLLTLLSLRFPRLYCEFHLTCFSFSRLNLSAKKKKQKQPNRTTLKP